MKGVNRTAESYMTSRDRRIYNFALRGQDYGWEEKNEPKQKVVLTNPEALKNVGLKEYVNMFRGTGHVEWEYIMGGWMIEAVGEAIDSGEECDVTRIFNTDFLAKSVGDDGSHVRRFTMKQVYDHIIPLFKIMEHSKDVLRIAINM